MTWQSPVKKKCFSLKRFFKSFRYAFNGIISAYKTEMNLWVDTLGLIIVIILCLFFPVSRIELCLILISIGLAFFFEMMNTALEYAVDVSMPNIHPLAKLAKDISSGAVLMGDLFLLGSALLIFIPKIIAFFEI